MKRRGMSLIEVSVAGTVIVILMTGLLSIFTSISAIQKFTSTMPTVQDSAQRLTLDMAGAIRKATLATSADTNCTLNAALEGTSADSITVYSGSNGSVSKTTYANSGSNVVKTIGATPPVIWYANASLAFTYYRSSTYHGSQLTTFTPTSTTTPEVIAVGITGTYSSGGLTATYSTIVRLRNGPLKLNVSD
jgi:hypothetical protein